MDTNLRNSKKKNRTARSQWGSLPRFTVTSRNLCSASLSNPQISMKLRSNAATAAAIFPSWNCDVSSRGALSVQTFKETGHHGDDDDDEEREMKL